MPTNDQVRQRRDFAMANLTRARGDLQSPRADLNTARGRGTASPVGAFADDPTGGAPQRSGFDGEYRSRASSFVVIDDSVPGGWERLLHVRRFHHPPWGWTVLSRLGGIGL